MSQGMMAHPSDQSKRQKRRGGSPPLLEYGANVPPAGGIGPRVLFLLAGAGIFLAAVVGFAGDAWPAVIYGLLTDAALTAAWLLAAAGVGAWLPVPRNVREDAGDENYSASSHRALHFATAAALGLGIFSLAVLGLGLAGALNRLTAWILFAAGLVAGVVFLFRRYDRTSFESATNAWMRMPVRWGWLWLVSVPTLALVSVAAMVPPGVLWAGTGGSESIGDPHGYDVVEYHLQIPREWYEAGRIVPLEHNVFSYFPFNVEMHYLLAMHLRGGPWAGMYLAQFMHVAYILLTVVAIYGIARRLGASAAVATVCALAAASTPWLALLAPVAYNEGGLLLYGTLALGWALVAMTESAHRLRHLALAGAMAGFACGCKLTAAPTVLVAVAAIAAVVLFMNGTGLSIAQRLRRALAGPVVFGVVGVVIFSPWLVRNAVWAGNPVFPEAMPLLGKGHFTDVQVERWQRAHRAREEERSAGARLQLGWERIAIDWRYGWLILPLGVILGAISARKSPAVVAMLLLMAFLLVFWLAITHLQSRFFVLGVPVAALLLGFVRWKAWPIAGAVLFTLVSVGSWVRLSAAIAPVAGHAGLTDVELVMGFLVPEGSLQRVKSAPRVTLIGDARAFWYAVPMSRLRYRTVFDVDTSAAGDDDVLTAWAGGETPVTGEIRLVDPGELRRFSDPETGYWQIPPLPKELADRDRAFVLE